MNEFHPFLPQILVSFYLTYLIYYIMLSLMILYTILFPLMTMKSTLIIM